jgi:hypothetical protein
MYHNSCYNNYRAPLYPYTPYNPIPLNPYTPIPPYPIYPHTPIPQTPYTPRTLIPPNPQYDLYPYTPKPPMPPDTMREGTVREGTGRRPPRGRGYWERVASRKLRDRKKGVAQIARQEKGCRANCATGKRVSRKLRDRKKGVAQNCATGTLNPKPLTPKTASYDAQQCVI